MALDVVKPRIIHENILYHLYLNSERQLFESIRKCVSIDEINWRRSITGCFANGVFSEGGLA